MNELSALDSISNASTYYSALERFTRYNREYAAAANYEWIRNCIEAVKALTIIRLLDEGKIVDQDVISDARGVLFKEFIDNDEVYKFQSVAEQDYSYICLAEEVYCLPKVYRIYLPYYKFLSNRLIGDARQIFYLLVAEEGRYSYRGERKIKEVLGFLYEQKQFKTRLTWTCSDDWNLTLVLYSHGIKVGELHFRITSKMVEKHVKEWKKFTRVYDYYFINDRRSVLC